MHRTYLTHVFTRSQQVMLEDSRALYEQLGNHRRMTRQLNGLGAIARMRGDLDRAQKLCDRSLSLSRSIDDHMRMWIDLLSLGFVAFLQRDLQRAATLLHEGLHLQKELQTTFGVLDCIQLLAGIALRSRQPEHAAHLLGAAERLGQTLAFVLDWLPAQREEFRQHVAAMRKELGDAAFLAAWAEVARGSSIDLWRRVSVIGRSRSGSSLRSVPLARTSNMSWTNSTSAHARKSACGRSHT